MPLLGSAAILLAFDVERDAVREHDDWHTHEHLPERLAIPGFLRGTRWVATGDGPGYMVIYEARDLAALTSDAYLERLNHPTPWTTKIMRHYRGMIRGLCSVRGSCGLGLGPFAALVRFRAAGRDELHAWMLEEHLPALPSQPGLGSAHLLEGAAAAAMTHEQRLRGADGAVSSAMIVTGYDQAAVEAVGIHHRETLSTRGAEDVVVANYRMAYALSSAELER